MATATYQPYKNGGGEKAGDSLHAARVQVAARGGHSDQTGGESQQQRVAAPVQRQRQELT